MYPTMGTTAHTAARTGLSPHTLRRMAAAGHIPGALRLSGTTGPWRFPTDWTPDTPTPGSQQGDPGGVTAPRLTGRRAHLMSSHGAPSPLTRARAVVAALDTVTARPARALVDVLYLTAETATRHQPGRDGWCMACGWQYPCADRLTADRALDRATAVVLDGAR